MPAYNKRIDCPTCGRPLNLFLRDQREYEIDSDKWYPRFFSPMQRNNNGREYCPNCDLEFDEDELLGTFCEIREKNHVSQIEDSFHLLWEGGFTDGTD